VEEALKILPFKALEPKGLGNEWNLDATQVIEPRPGETDATLPRVRFIYQADPTGTIFLTEGPLTGATPDGGAPIDIGSHKGWLLTQPAATLVWEQDGVRVEMRGRDLTQEQLMKLATSLGPFAGSGE
jgi:hypothetical protein